MKLNLKFYTLAIALLAGLASCSKYGYEANDGYKDYTGETQGGEIDTNMALIDRSMFAKARVFPGLVDASEKRVENESLTLNLNFTKQTAEALRISVAPQPQYSTGYYAAPGELVKINVPQGIEGLVVQIGAWTDNLSGKYPLLREPSIITKKQLYSGDNYVRNLFGGHIYILASFAYPNPVTLKISNAVVSPDFILDETPDAEWVAKVKASKVPWLEFRTKRVIFTFPRDKVMATFNGPEPLTNPSVVMRKWNDVFELDYNGWMGLSDNAPDEKDRSPQSAWRGVLDIQLSVGYGHNGFPFVGQNDSYWFESFTRNSVIENSSGTWGSYHEFGHNCQQGKIWSWSTLGETTNNLFSFKVANRIHADYNILHPAVSEGFPLAIAYASTPGTKNFDVDAAMNDPFKRMTPFVQLCEIYGYGIVTYFYTQARHAPRLNNGDLVMHNWVYEKACDYTGKDLASFFEAWGILISPSVKDKMAGKYPELDKQIWTYNPLDKTGGTAAVVPKIYPVIVSATSSSTAEGSLPNLLDNNVSTYWQSNYGDATISNTLGFPISIVLQTAKLPINITGITLTQRQNSNSYVKDFEVLVSSDDANYTSLGTFVASDSNTKANFMFTGGAVSARYVKLVIKSSYTSGVNYTSLSEFNIIKP